MRWTAIAAAGIIIIFRIISYFEAKAKIQLIDKLRLDANTSIKDFENYLQQFLVIDSNIWMNENYDSFFLLLGVACNNQNCKLILYGPQFDEISNIKKNSTFGKGKNKSARIAINRIEEFQKNNRLKIEPVTIDAQRGAYADPMLVKLITKKSREGHQCTFISDDIELRVRIRQHLVDHSKATWEIVELASILPKCLVFQEAWNLGLLKPTVESDPGK